MKPQELLPHLKGVQAIMATPFKHNYEIDEQGLRSNTRFLLDAGIEWLSPLGTGGELASLTTDEWKRVIEIVVDGAKGRGAIVVPGAGSPCTTEAIGRCRFAQEAGADGVMLTPPYYYPTTFKEAYAFYEMVSGEVDIGIVMYYFPAMHHITVTMSELVEILKIPGIVGAKFSTSDIMTFERVVRELKDDIAIVSGNGEHLAPYTYLAGAKGISSWYANFVPEIPLEIDRAGQAGDFEKVKEITTRIAPLLDFIWEKETPECTKEVMAWLGLPAGPIRPPQIPGLTDETGAELRDALKKIGVL